MVLGKVHAGRAQISRQLQPAEKYRLVVAESHPASMVLGKVHEGMPQMCGQLQLAGTSRLVVACMGQELQRNEGGLAGRGFDQDVWHFL